MRAHERERPEGRREVFDDEGLESNSANHDGDGFEPEKLKSGRPSLVENNQRQNLSLT